MTERCPQKCGVKLRLSQTGHRWVKEIYTPRHATPRHATPRHATRQTEFGAWRSHFYEALRLSKFGRFLIVFASIILAFQLFLRGSTSLCHRWFNNVWFSCSFYILYFKIKCLHRPLPFSRKKCGCSQRLNKLLSSCSATAQRLVGKNSEYLCYLPNAFIFHG